MKARKILSALLAAVMLLSVCVTGVSSADKKLPFTDTPEGEWYYDAVKYVYENGLMNGTGDGTKFSPNTGLTRGMVVTVIYRAERSPGNKFTGALLDVAEGQYYSDAAEWAFKQGIVNGTGFDDWGDPYFSPDRIITRQELATMFIRYAEYKGVITDNDTTLDKFTDKASVADWAKGAMTWAVSCGLITGTGSGKTLSPTDTATRSQFATIFHRFKTLSFEYSVKYNPPMVQSLYTEPDYPLVTDADIYVAVDGNDNNPGTIEKPLATFEAAVKKIREVKKNGERKVAFMGGDYGITNVEMTSADSGTAESPITYCAYGDDEVYFTNGLYISKTEFKPLDKSDDPGRFNSEVISDIKKVDLSSLPGGDSVNSSSTLFTDGKFCTIARTPNKEGMQDVYYPGFTEHVIHPDSPYADIDELVKAVHAGTFSSNDEVSTHIDHTRLIATHLVKDKLLSYHTLEGVQLVGYIGKVWNQDMLNITTIDKDTGIVSYSNLPAFSYYAMIEDQQKVYINNVSEELDFKGEYWIDQKTNTLYVYAPENDYYIATAGTFVKADHASHMSFVNLNFRCTTASPFVLDYCDYVTIDRCNFSYVCGNDGVYPSFCLNLTVKNCEFEYFSGYGLAIKGTSIGKRADYDYMALESQNIVVENNLFHDIALVDIHSDVAAVKLLSNVIGAKIAHNEFYNSSRHAISFGKDSHDVTIEYNYIHHCMINSADGGAIHNGRGMVGPANIIRYNLFCHITPELPGGTMGIYLDDFENDTEIYGNVFYNVANSILTNGGRDNYIHDNAMIDSGTVTINFSTDRLLEIFKNGDSSFISQYDSLLPKEGSPYYSIWQTRCASNYKLDHDPANYANKNSIFAPNNTVVNNVSVGDAFGIREESVAVGTYENNNVYKHTENPVFKNPALGDYGIKDGCGFADNHFEKIGRY